MKIKVKEFLESYQPLVNLSLVKMPAVMKTRVARIMVQATPEHEILTKAQSEIAEDFGGEIQLGGVVEFKDVETRKKAQAELKKLEESDVEIRFDTFSLSELEKLDINAWDLAKLSWLYGGLGAEQPKEEA